MRIEEKVRDKNERKRGKRDNRKIRKLEKKMEDGRCVVEK